MADNPFAQPSTLPFRAAAVRPHPRCGLPAGLRGWHGRAVARGRGHRAQPAAAHVRQHDRGARALREAAANGWTAPSGGSTPATPNPQMQKIDTEMAPRLAAHARCDPARPGAVGARGCACTPGAPALHLDPESLQLLARYHIEIRARRRAPDEPQKARLRVLNEEISTLHDALQAKRAQGHHRRRRGGREAASLQGLSPATDRRGRQAGRGRPRAGRQVADRAAEHHQAAAARAAVAIARCASASTRPRSPAASGGATDNTAVIVRAGALRAERAALLGYPNHAAYQLGG